MSLGTMWKVILETLMLKHYVSSVTFTQTHKHTHTRMHVQADTHDWQERDSGW